MTYEITIFAALADPTRRTIFERLVRQPMTVGSLAATLPVSRPAVSQHLKVLKEAHLVSDRAQGTCRIYTIDPRGIEAMRKYLDAMWDNSLASFKKFIEEESDS